MSVNTVYPTTPSANTNTSNTSNTSSTSSSSNASASTAAINQGLAALADNQTTFLSLLTTQLKNQDPLNPTDPTQFTQQITQMTGVEQQLLSNQLLQQLVTTQGLAQASNMIGKTVSAPGATSSDPATTGVVTGVTESN
jgi:flagellar hook assembly protein FlgD